MIYLEGQKWNYRFYCNDLTFGKQCKFCKKDTFFYNTAFTFITFSYKKHFCIFYTDFKWQQMFKLSHLRHGTTCTYNAWFQITVSMLMTRQWSNHTWLYLQKYDVEMCIYYCMDWLGHCLSIWGEKQLLFTNFLHYSWSNIKQCWGLLLFMFWLEVEALTDGRDRQNTILRIQRITDVFILKHYIKKTCSFKNVTFKL